MDVAIHSRLISFGRIEGGVSTVYEAIVDVIGPKGTIVFPTTSCPLSVKRSTMVRPPESVSFVRVSLIVKT